MADKIACTVPGHRGVEDCLGQLDAVRDPSDVPPDALAREVPCLFVRLKHRIVRLRRGTHDDWPWFRREVVEHLDPIARLQELNTKYLVRYGDRLDEVLARGRLRHMVVAFQSGNDRILDLMKRGYDRAGLARAMALLGRHAIAKHGHAIIGFPTETDAEFDETLAMVALNRFDSCSFFLYQDRRTAPAHKIEPKVSEDDKLVRLGRAERFFTERGYEVRRRPDKLQVFLRPAAEECGVAARAAERTV